MFIRFIDSKEEYTSITYDENEGVFNIKSQENGEQIQCIPDIHVINNYDPGNFEYIILYNEREDCSENNIFIVNVPDTSESGKEKQRIGWIFPIQALESTEHNYSDVDYFKMYAYVAYCLLLNDINEIEKRQFTSEIKLSDFYGDNIHILVIDHENTDKLRDFNIDDYVVSLYMYGYSFEGKGNLISDINYDKKQLLLKKVPPLLESFSVIPIIFKTTAVREYNAEFSRFYAYYQLIEIFISVVFDVELQHFIDELEENSKILFESKEKLNELINEKKRVIKLMNNYCGISSELSTNLNAKAKILLELNDKKTSNSMAENLYMSRCLLVHELYNVDKQSEDVLRELNDLFLQVILEILNTFKSPY